LTQVWLDALLRASLQGAFLVAVVWAALLVCRRVRPSVRAWVWMVASAKFLLASAFVVELPLLAPSVPSGGVSTAEGSVTFGYGPSASTPFDWIPVLFGLWAAGVVSVVWRALSGHRRLAKMARESFEVDGRTARAWTNAGAGLDVPVREHPDVGVPLVLGVLRPVVLLPEGLSGSLSDEELEMVLSHEAAHLRRRDAWAALFMFVCHALFFFHPGMWLARREWQIEREAACDRAAMERCRADARRYAAMLVKVSVGAERSPALALSAVPAFRTLNRRINEMKRTNEKRSGKVMLVVLAVLVSAGAVPVVLVQRKPHFGTGVFETQAPKVKVTRTRSGGEAVAQAIAPSAVATGQAGAPTAVAMPATVRTTEGAAVLAPVATGAAAQAGPSGVASVAQAGPGTGYATTEVAQTGGAAVTVQRAETRTSGTTTPAMAGPIVQGVAAPSTGGIATTAQDMPTKTSGSVAVGGQTTVAEDVSPSQGAPSSVTIVLRDKGAKDGEGLDRLVTIDVKATDVTTFLRTLSRRTGVSINVRGVRSRMSLSAQVEGVTLGEVMGTVARAYGLEWRLEDDGSLTVQPFRG
jgi:beta-lactamase regulating signal transducer with metallopeptidase domain